ncbi:MAG: peptidyl-prolyl cis-trans isomerase [Halioglobus sp.]|nr:peptidyl-prolyl cis-trans isomerase [Halioglobus sp.]
MLKRTFLNLILLSTALFTPLAACAEEAADSKPAAEPQGNPSVIIKTSEGDIILELFADKAPVTVENFLGYVDAGFYSGTIFHRVIPNFMIQGGGFDEKMQEKDTRDPIRNESKNKLHNTRGTIAMARTNNPHSATAQFFINHRNNLNLDWAPGRDGYAVFGEVTEGLDVVDYIATAPTGKRGRFRDVPEKAIVIKDIVRKP